MARASRIVCCMDGGEPGEVCVEDCANYGQVDAAELRVKVGPTGYDARWWWAIMAPDRYVVTDGIEASWDDASATGLARLRAMVGDV